jgi:hypothetical protein
MSKFLLPWRRVNNAYYRYLFTQDNAVIGSVYQEHSIGWGRAQIYLNMAIPFLYGHTIYHPMTYNRIRSTRLSLSTNSAMNQCDQKLVELGYTLLSPERAEKLRLLI